MNKVYTEEILSSHTIANPEESTMEAAMDRKHDKKTILFLRPCSYPGKVNREVDEDLGCTTSGITTQSPQCPTHLAWRLSLTKSLYGRPPRQPLHDRSLYSVNIDITEKEEIELTMMKRLVDKGDIVQNSQNNNWYLVRLVCRRYRVYCRQIAIVETVLHTRSVQAGTMCIQAHQPPPEANSR